MTIALRLQKKSGFIHAPLLGMVLSLTFAASGAFAGTCPSNLTYNQTAQTECPGYNPANPATACKSTGGNSYQGPLSKAVLAGCDPPITLRPDSGLGKVSNNAGSITQGGKCPPPIGGSNTPTCPTTPNSHATNVGAASPLTNPFINLPSIPLSGLSSLPSLPCGGGVPLLNQITNFGDNLTLGSVLSFGNINIGIPPVNINPPSTPSLPSPPSFNVSVPSLSISSLGVPDSLPNINVPLPSVSVPSVSVPSIGTPSLSIPSLGSLAGNCPNLNLPTINASGNILLPGNISLPNISLPSVDVNLPMATVPNLNLNIPNLGGLNLNPSIASLPGVPNFDLGTLTLSTPMPSLALPNIAIPSIPSLPSLPSLNLNINCSSTPTASSEMGTLDNLLSAGLLNTPQTLSGTISSGINTIANTLSSICQGSSLQLSQTGVSLVLPSITTPLDLSSPTLTSTTTSLSPPISLGSQTISYPPAGQVYNIPVNSPVAFDVYVTDDLILPNGGTTIAANGTMETLAARSMFIVLPPGPWDGKSAQIVVGTDIDVPITSPFPTTTNRALVNVQFPNTTINSCTYTNVSVVQNGVLDVNPFWRCPCNYPNEHNGQCYQSSDNNWSNGVSKVFTLAPLVQDYSAIPTSKPNIDITTSAIVMNQNQPSSTVPSVVPPTGSFLSIPDNTPITFALNTTGTMLMPAGGTITDPTGNTVNIGQDGVVQSLGNGQVNIGYALKNADGTYQQNADGTYNTTIQTALTYPAGQTYISVSTTEIEVPAGASLPISATGSIAMPQVGG